MASSKFYLVGEDVGSALDVDISNVHDLESLSTLISGQLAVVEPKSIAFQVAGGQAQSMEDITKATEPIGITVDGCSVREIPGPKGIPLVGNYFEIFPDHLGNHQRLFQRYGPIFQTTSMGRKVIEINDPDLALIILTESPFFSKIINENHPLYPIKSETAGVFISDTDNPSWKLVHKFLPPALGPKAVRHYAPLMNETIDSAIPVFDQLEKSDDAWNVYQYMLKLGSQAIGKLVLDMDFKHFTDVDAPLAEFVLTLAEALSLNKKISSKGDWYAKLPFGDPKRLKELAAWQHQQILNAISRAQTSGNEALPLQDAALTAANMIDYLVRATDGNGQKLPHENLADAVQVAAGAGFLTTSTLLSWLIYGLVTYPGMQARLLQELVDNDWSDDIEVTADITDKLTFQTKYIKEMQRVHNPSYQPGRTARLDCVLPGGYKVHEGDVCIAALHHIHHNPKLWINPELFDPDRWDKDPVHHKAQYIPFATGQRMCIGFNFALQEVKIFLPKLVWRYHWMKEGETAVEYDPFFQLIRPVNLYARTQRRTKYPSKSASLQS